MPLHGSNILYHYWYPPSRYRANTPFFVDLRVVDVLIEEPPHLPLKHVHTVAIVVIIPSTISRTIPRNSSWLRSTFPLPPLLPALPLLSPLLLPAPVSVEITVRVDTRPSFPVRTKILVLTIGSVRIVWRMVMTEKTAGGGSGCVTVTTTVCARAQLNVSPISSIRVRKRVQGRGDCEVRGHRGLCDATASTTMQFFPHLLVKALMVRIELK